MIQSIVASKALAQIGAIVHELMIGGGRLRPETWAQVQALYAKMQQEYPTYKVQAVVRFLQALEQIPEVEAWLNEAIDSTKGPADRDFTAAPTSLGLPPELKPMEYKSAKPPVTREFDLPSPGPVPAMEDDAGGGAAGGGSDPPGDKDDSAVNSPTSPPQVDNLPTPPPSPSKLTRYPYLSYPNQVALNKSTSLTVVLDLEPPKDKPSTAIQIDNTAPTPPKLEVVVQGEGFFFPDGNQAELEISLSQKSQIMFDLIPQKEGPQTLRVEFYQNRRYLGEATCTTQVVGQMLGLVAPAKVQTKLGAVEIGDKPVPPDLSFKVRLSSDGKTLSFEGYGLNDPVNWNSKPLGSVQLLKPPLEQMQAVYDQLNQLARSSPDDPALVADQQRRLDDLGRGLWTQLVPEELKTAYWQFKDQVKSLQITSDEPWIPWEMVKPFRFENGTRQDEPFWCEHFDLSRWLAGDGPADNLPFTQVQPVVPSKTDLANVQSELDYLSQLSRLRPGVSTAQPFSAIGEVIGALETGSFSVLHVATHGNFDAQMPNDSAIALSDGQLRPSNIAVQFSGLRQRPLIFLNACHGARLEFAFTGLGGWAEKLVGESRVAAFIGAAWEVNDALALEFTKTFYNALLGDQQSLGESFRLARAHIHDLQPANSTWLAYVLYADPIAKAQVPL